VSSALGTITDESHQLVVVGHRCGELRSSGPVAWLLADALRGYFWMSMRVVELRAAAAAGVAAAEAAGDHRARAAARLNLADAHYRRGDHRPAGTTRTRFSLPT
jgi:hypothetical protein